MQERASATPAGIAERVEAARALAAYEPPAPAPAVFTGRYRREGLSVARTGLWEDAWEGIVAWLR